jgi:hypothetical protein
VAITATYCAFMTGWALNAGDWGMALLNWVSAGVNLLAAWSCNNSRLMTIAARAEWLNNTKRMEDNNAKADKGTE